jgi:signal peptidase I
MLSRRSETQNEYNQVNASPIAKGLIQGAVTLIDAIIMFMLIWNTFVFIIPTGSWINFVSGKSMEPNLTNGQIVFTDMGPIDRGDIVTAYYPANAEELHPTNTEKFVVKRVIGLPGDRIIIDRTGVYVNGELLDEYYLTPENKAATYMEGKYNSVLLDEDEYFLMGDNRTVSYDSRYFGVFDANELLYRQSITPNSNFWLKLIFVLFLFALDIAIYTLVEFVLTECAYAIFFKNKKTDVVEISENAEENKNNNISEN